MGNCLLGSEKRTEKAAKLAEANMREYQVLAEVAHQKLGNALLVRRQIVARHLKSVPKAKRAEFVRSSQSADAKRVREAHAAVKQAERELSGINGLLNVARSMLQTAQIRAQAQAAHKMAKDFTQLLPKNSLSGDVTSEIEKLADQRDDMNDLHEDVQDAFGNLNDPEAMDDEDWLNGDLELGAEEEDEVVEHVSEQPSDRKVSAVLEISRLPAAPRVVRPTAPAFELLE
jgi:hypothetical protein